MTTITYSIYNQQSGAELGEWSTTKDSVAGVEDVLRQLGQASGDECLLADLDAGELWTCATGTGGLRGELGDLRVVPAAAANR